jgi:hypothetical protein
MEKLIGEYSALKRHGTTIAIHQCCGALFLTLSIAFEHWLEIRPQDAMLIQYMMYKGHGASKETDVLVEELLKLCDSMKGIVLGETRLQRTVRKLTEDGF